MSNIKQYIASFLCAVIILPIILHTAHIVFHHTVDADVVAFYSQSQVEQIHTSSNHQNGQGDIQTVDVETEHTDFHCQICSYQFSINEVPQAVEIDTYKPKARFITKDIVVSVPTAQSLKQTSLRAPPMA